MLHVEDLATQQDQKRNKFIHVGGGKERKRKERKNLLLWKDEQEEIRHCGAAEATWWKSWDGMWQGVVEGLEKRKPCGA